MTPGKHPVLALWSHQASDFVTMLKKRCKNTIRGICFAALTFLAGVAFGAPPAFQLRDTAGAVHTPAEWRAQKAVLLFFVTTDCPVGNSYVPELNRIREAYAGRGVLMYAVQADTTVAESEVARYAKDYRYTFPLLLDPRQVLVQLTGATVTPEAAVLSPEGKLLYLGRIDNRVADFGKARPQATERDVRDALDAVLAGKAVPHPVTKSIGCAINRVK
jgi:peroxiredoxin